MGQPTFFHSLNFETMERYFDPVFKKVYYHPYLYFHPKIYGYSDFMFCIDIYDPILDPSFSNRIPWNITTLSFYSKESILLVTFNRNTHSDIQSKKYSLLSEEEDESYFQSGLDEKRFFEHLENDDYLEIKFFNGTKYFINKPDRTIYFQSQLQSNFDTITTVFRAVKFTIIWDWLVNIFYYLRQESENAHLLSIIPSSTLSKKFNNLYESFNIRTGHPQEYSSGDLKNSSDPNSDIQIDGFQSPKISDTQSNTSLDSME
jgi:hypothetical protein